MENFSYKKEKADAVTPENFEAHKKQLSDQIWSGEYSGALPLADRLLEYRTEKGDRNAALVNYASNYYSAASKLWKEGGVKNLPSVGKYMNTALHALQERLEKEIESGGGKKKGMIPVSLNGMSASELDVMQAIYRRAAVIADKVPLVKPIRQLLLSKDSDKVRDWDAAALLSIRAGLNKVREAKKTGKPGASHTEIFLTIGSFEIADRYGWKRDAESRAGKIFELADKYPWPSEKGFKEKSNSEQHEYRQAIRVARQLEDVAKTLDDEERIKEFREKTKAYLENIKN